MDSLVLCKGVVGFGWLVGCEVEGKRERWESGRCRTGVNVHRKASSFVSFISLVIEEKSRICVVRKGSFLQFALSSSSNFIFC